MRIENSSVQGEIMTTSSKEDNIDLLLELAQRQDNTLTGFMIKTDKSFQEVNGRLDKLESRFDRLEKRFDGVESDIREIKALLIRIVVNS